MDFRDKQLLELVAAKLNEEGILCFVTLAWNIAIDAKIVKGSEEAFLVRVQALMPPNTCCGWELHGNVYSWLGVYVCQDTTYNKQGA